MLALYTHPHAQANPHDNKWSSVTFVLDASMKVPASTCITPGSRQGEERVAEAVRKCCVMRRC